MPIDQIMVEGINIDEADYYESGLSQDDLLNMYVQPPINQAAIMRKLDIRVVEDAQGNRQRIRRNFYFENAQVENTYTVTIARVAQVIFNPAGNFQWWKTRAVTQQLLRRRKRVVGDVWQKLSARDMFEGEGYVPVKIKHDTAYLWRKIENMFDRLNCQQHLFVYAMSLMGFINSEDMVSHDLFDFESYQNFMLEWPEFSEIGENFVYLRDVLLEENAILVGKQGY